MTFKQTHDVELIRSIVTHPKLYDWLVDDTAGPAGDFQPPGLPWNYMLTYDGEELLGLFILVPRSSVVVEVHTCLLPNSWGPRAAEAYRQGIEWIWKNTGFQKVMGNIRATNRLALRIAEGAGLKRIGLNESCVMKHGRLQDQWIVGIRRPA